MALHSSSFQTSLFLKVMMKGLHKTLLLLETLRGLETNLARFSSITGCAKKRVPSLYFIRSIVLQQYANARPVYNNILMGKSFNLTIT